MSAFGFLGSLVGGVTGLVGTSMTNKTNWNNQQMANKMSLQISRENNEFNAKEAQKARDWMSYANQRKLMEDAGLNPALMFGDGNLSASSASASSAGIPSFGAAVAQNPFQGFNFADIAAGLKSLAEAKKIGGVDTQKAEAEINNIMTTTEGQRIANSYAGRLNDMELKKGAAFVDKTFKEADNLVKQGKLIEAEEALKRAQEATENETKRLTGAQADYQTQLASLAYESIMSDINLKKSQTGLNNMQTAVLPRQVAAQETQAKAAKDNADTNRRVGEQSIRESITQQFKMRAEIVDDLFEAVKKRAETKGIRLSNENLEKLMPIISQKAQLEYDQAHQDYWNPFRWILGSGGSFVDGVIKGAMLK